MSNRDPLPTDWTCQKCGAANSGTTCWKCKTLSATRLNGEALTAIIGEHSRDHTEGGVSTSGCTGCAMVAHLEAMEREREADRAALDWAKTTLDIARMLVASTTTFNRDALRLALSQESTHAFAIQRAQDARAGEGT